MSDIMQAHFEKLLKSHGRYFLLLVQSRRIRCAHWDGKEHDPHCLSCGGTGWTVRYLRYKGIRQNASDVVTHPRLTQPTDVGSIWSPAYLFYFRPGIPLKPGDRVYEVGWRNAAPWGFHNAYDVRHTHVERGENSKPVYLYTGTMHISVDAPFHEKLIYRLTKGDG